MDWKSISTANCSVQRALDVVGEKWSLLVLRDAFHGVRRFDELRRHVGVSEAVLADRLRTLVAAGILAPRSYREPGRRTRYEYVVTARGWELQPVVVGLLQWGDRYLADEDGPPVLVRHRGCGAPAEAVLRCSADGQVLSPRQTETVAGPGARPLARRAGSAASARRGSTGRRPPV
jgi:DNA-binding HxlR family transcriptional regulator